jgi:hypothetical protein
LRVTLVAHVLVVHVITIATLVAASAFVASIRAETSQTIQFVITRASPWIQALCDGIAIILRNTILHPGIINVKPGLDFWPS